MKKVYLGLDFNHFLQLVTNIVRITIRVDRLVSDHLRTQRRSNAHTLFLCFSSSKSICSSSPEASNAAKIAQFSKGMRKIMGSLVLGGSVFGGG